ncbi:MAG: cytochrome c1, partial [Campylobacterales bacterium]|nr:cytochrome c1 [Campylobacterales bacterium]
HLEGTAMPRVGLKKDVQEQVISYLEEIGDSKKDERTKVGIYIIGFFIILSVFAYLWKRKIWKDL